MYNDHVLWGTICGCRHSFLNLLCCIAGSGNVASGQQSDHLLMVAAFDGWTAATAQVRAEPLQS